MAQKRRTPKQDGLDRITLMVPAELKAKLDAKTEAGVRTFSDVARECLRRGLEVMSAEETDDQLAPWPRAISDAAGIVAENVEQVCRSTENSVRLGIARVAMLKLFEAWGAKKPDADEHKLGEALAEVVALSVMRVKPMDGPSGNFLTDVGDGSYFRRRRAAKLLRIKNALGLKG